MHLIPRCCRGLELQERLQSRYSPKRGSQKDKSPFNKQGIL